MAEKALRIFIVEDESLISSGLECCITELGHHVAGITASGEEAVALIPGVKPDLILMDINLPGMDGITALKLLSKTCSIPCIFITGYSDKELVAQADTPNTFGYLIKPVDINDLRAAINVAVSRFDDYRNVDEELQETRRALRERKLIERAKGILMDSFSMKESQAMQFMQKKSRDRNKKLAQVAKEIIQADSIMNK